MTESGKSAVPALQARIGHANGHQASAGSVGA